MNRVESMKRTINRAVAKGFLAFVAAAGPHAGISPATRAALVATQMLGLALCRYVLRLEPVAKLSEQDVVAWLAPTIQRYLAEPPGELRCGSRRPSAMVVVGLGRS